MIISTKGQNFSEKRKDGARKLQGLRKQGGEALYTLRDLKRAVIT